MRHFRQISFLLFFSVLLYLIVGCETDKPNQPIENTTDTIAFASGDSIVDTIADTTGDTTTPIPDNFRITIERTRGIIQGQMTSIEINMHNPSSGNLFMGGYDLLLGYDAHALTFHSADPGQFLTDCGWEYFTYRFGPIINSSSFRSLRIVAIAETNNGTGNHPDCFTDAGYISNQLVVLNFLVSNDRQYECDIAPVQFFWYDCGDNTISSIDGRLLYFSNHIFNQKFNRSINYIYTSFVDYSFNFAKDTPFPTYFGANSSCDSASQHDTLRIIDFVNGGIDIVCADSIDGRGDLNLNEIPYEIADVILLSNYFLYGLSVFTVNTNGQIMASDVNADEITLSVADLVYIIRVILGDAFPYSRDTENQYVTPFQPLVTRLISDGTLHVNSTMGAMLLIVAGDVTAELLADDMIIQSNFDGTNTHILVYSLEGNTFSGDIMKVLGEIVSIEFSSVDGKMVMKSL